ncbi:MAG: hypothetical protein ICV85_13160 [Tolypothrix sp. T3-bin4]|nr:hypothetical protein [Tolypothrix sp. Co-bin9]MBD0303077.1 hypothetical protein [Tolypothrix sp. T3-bin4]
MNDKKEVVGARQSLLWVATRSRNKRFSGIIPSWCVISSFILKTSYFS